VLNGSKQRDFVAKEGDNDGEFGTEHREAGADRDDSAVELVAEIQQLVAAEAL